MNDFAYYLTLTMFVIFTPITAVAYGMMAWHMIKRPPPHG